MPKHRLGPQGSFSWARGPLRICAVQKRVRASGTSNARAQKRYLVVMPQDSPLSFRDLRGSVPASAEQDFEAARESVRRARAQRQAAAAFDAFWQRRADLAQDEPGDFDPERDRSAGREAPSFE
jgi:hypothetical protein